MEIGIFKNSETYTESAICEKLGIWKNCSNSDSKRQAKHRLIKNLKKNGIVPIEIAPGHRLFSGKFLNEKVLEMTNLLTSSD